MPKEWCLQVDKGITDFLAEALQIPNPTQEVRNLMHTDLKDGGLGIPSSFHRSEAAWVGAWEGGIGEVARVLALQS